MAIARDIKLHASGLAIALLAILAIAGCQSPAASQQTGSRGPSVDANASLVGRTRA